MVSVYVCDGWSDCMLAGTLSFKSDAPVEAERGVVDLSPESRLSWGSALGWDHVRS